MGQNPCSFGAWIIKPFLLCTRMSKSGQTEITQLSSYLNVTAILAVDSGGAETLMFSANAESTAKPW
jgi:hypothetical protein